ncbi:hypothetical protein CC2G_011798 [Coprinopsis cinerea AmutBmut pab1-1]|nr:hypothetical protein CC2G_011798 [Coprinopsis cinerea AmutBmut pab1-1]
MRLESILHAQAPSADESAYTLAVVKLHCSFNIDANRRVCTVIRGKFNIQHRMLNPPNDIWWTQVDIPRRPNRPVLRGRACFNSER